LHAEIWTIGVMGVAPVISDTYKKIRHPSKVLYTFF